jgi:hypothetical protein
VIYGYARVSTDGQSLESQLSALTAAGAEKVYSEKQSGAKTDRAALARVLDGMFASLRGGPSHDMQDTRVVPADRHRASIMGDGPDGFYHLRWA